MSASFVFRAGCAAFVEFGAGRVRPSRVEMIEYTTGPARWARMAGVRARLATPREPLIAPIPALAHAPFRLFLTSFTLLFVELILIRWIPALVTYVGFFSNYILMASFLGIGLGILLGRALHPTASPFPALLAVVVGVILHEKLEVQFKAANEIFFGLAESHAADANFIVLPLVFILV